jgi:murein DD-endopeptidase MepM/ murein hydrolase activator NlpD
MKAPWPAGITYLCIKGNFGDTHDIPFTYYAWDFEMPVGSPVVAAAPGIVSWTGFTGEDGYGNQVRISHRYGLYTLYAHLDTPVVRVGQAVEQGECIGISGVTGYTFSPHLHFCVLDGRGVSVPAFFADLGNPVEDQACTSQNRRRINWR